jgi:alpha-D-ribose 1-methylphosphonate 5-triphosphate diphosphatase
VTVHHLTPPLATGTSDGPGDRFALRHVRAVTPTGIVEDATIVCDDGVIVTVEEGAAAPRGAVDGRGLLCVPGLIDVHSDGLEKEIHPRANVTFPLDFALRAFEGRLRHAGVTTAFHGVAFEDNPRYQRTLDQASRLHRVLRERAASGSAPVDHRILHRLEARSPDGLDAMAPHLGALEPPSLLSFEDHTPGQGQYRDPAVLAAALRPDQLPPGTTAEDHVAALMAEGERLAHVRDRNLARVSALAADGAVRLLAHDCEDAHAVREAQRWGARVAEFPITVDAARAAREVGLPTVMGAPNVLRGGSHSGNVAAEELVRAELCDALASDYHPATLLGATFALAQRGVPLHRAVALVTAGPAHVAGIDDRGRLTAGLRADLALVAHDGTWPHVVATWRAPDPPTTI